jgi:hypothetical protein
MNAVREIAGAAWLRMLRVPSQADLMRLTDLEAAELYRARGHHRRVRAMLAADMDRRDREDRAKARMERARAQREQLRAEYDLYVHAAFLAAERDCRGELLSRAGIAAGIDPQQLWQMRFDRAARWASEELIQWWGEHGRWTYTTWKQQDRAPRAA